MTPLLSICIPTYNHAELLDQALARLTSLPAFASGDVEVVLSDNASTDGTRAVGERYAAAFPSRVNYFRNPENVFDRNYELALSHGRGLCGSGRFMVRFGGYFLTKQLVRSRDPSIPSG